MARSKKPPTREQQELQAYRLMGDLSILAASLPQTAFLELCLDRLGPLLGMHAAGIYIYAEHDRDSIGRGIAGHPARYPDYHQHGPQFPD